MGTRQQSFVSEFQRSFELRIGVPDRWFGDQTDENCATLPAIAELRRGGRAMPNERFELGDRRCDFAGWTVLAEFESSAISLHNLVKYVP